MPRKEHRPSTTPGAAQPQLRPDADCTKERAQQLTSQVVHRMQLQGRVSAALAARSRGADTVIFVRVGFKRSLTALQTGSQTPRPLA